MYFPSPANIRLTGLFAFIYLLFQLTVGIFTECDMPKIKPLCEINCQSPFYRTYTSETQRTQILQDIISYIQYHSSESLKVTELARYFGYNDKYLSSLFHEGTGMTLKQFILKSKMDSAMAELTDTNHTVSQIAYNVGFQDAHNFSTAFRKLTGMTPGQYRKSYGKRKLSFE